MFPDFNEQDACQRQAYLTWGYFEVGWGPIYDHNDNNNDKDDVRVIQLKSNFRPLEWLGLCSNARQLTLGETANIFWAFLALVDTLDAELLAATESVAPMVSVRTQLRADAFPLCRRLTAFFLELFPTLYNLSGERTRSGNLLPWDFRSSLLPHTGLDKNLLVSRPSLSSSRLSE